MFEHGRLRDVSWSELFPWVRIVSSARTAVSPSLLLLAALGLLAMWGGWSVIGWAFENSDERAVVEEAERVQNWPPEVKGSRLSSPAVVADPTVVHDSPFWHGWRRLWHPFTFLFDHTISFTRFTLYFLCALWAVIVWSLFGSAITRSAAVALARGDSLGFRRSLGHGVSRWFLYAISVGLPLMGIFLIALAPLVAGALMRVDALVSLVGLFWFVILIFGFLMTMLLVGLAFGWPLMWATISVENTDAFDALSRAYSYTFHRPLRYLFYLLVAALIGLLAWWVVAFFANWTINLSHWGVSMGAGAPRTIAINDTVAEAMAPAASRSADWEWNAYTVGAAMIGYWERLLRLLAYAFLFSYFWCAVTAIYYLLRQAEDGTELNEVALDEQREPYGLPPLKADARGVPTTTDGPTAPATPVAPPAAAPPSGPPEPPATPIGP